MAQPKRLATEDTGSDDDLHDGDGTERGPLPMPSWERKLVVASLVIHVADVGLDVLVLCLFFAEGCRNFGIGSAFVVLWACAASSLYMSCGNGGSGRDESADGLDVPSPSRQQQVLSFLFNLSQVQIFVQAYRCLFHRHEGDFFHTLRLMEAILEAAPNALVQLYALAYWPVVGVLPDYGQNLLRISVLTSFLSVGLSFSMFEQKVQSHTSAGYVGCVALMRMFEIASRTLTLALFAALTHPHGFWWALALDYLIMVCMTMMHKSVRSSYSFFLSVPLVLMSYEPVVWRREDHVVPKDRYYIVRTIEFVVMWIMITINQAHEASTTHLYTVIHTSSIWSGMCLSSWLSSIGLFMTLPCIYRVARRHELSRDGFANDPDFDPLEQGERGSSSESGSEGRDWESEDDDDDAQAQDGLLSGEATRKDFTNEQE